MRRKEYLKIMRQNIVSAKMLAVAFASLNVPICPHSYNSWQLKTIKTTL